MAAEAQHIPTDGESRPTTGLCPAVSVIVPNYNYARYLPQRIESILSQTFNDFEVILLDDASTDNSVDVMRRYADTDSRIIRIEVNATNTGSPFRQWHKGISLARGKYIWIAEADDFANPEFLATCVGVLDADPQVALAFTMSYMCDSESRLIPNSLETDASADGTTVVFNGLSYLVSRMHNTNCVYNASMAVFRRSSFDSFTINLYKDMRWIGDWAFWSEMMLHGDVAHIRSRLSTFRQHPVSTTRQSFRNESLRNEENAFDLTFSPIFRDGRYALLLGLSRPIKLNHFRKTIIRPIVRFIRSLSGNSDIYKGKTPETRYVITPQQNSHKHA